MTQVQAAQQFPRILDAVPRIARTVRGIIVRPAHGTEQAAIAVEV
jgi:hypothetical protein